MKESLCEALQNKLLSVQSPLRVGAELFFKSCWQWSPCRRIFLAFDAAVEKCTCLHWDESFFHAVQGGCSNFVCGYDAQVWPFKWKLPSSTFLCYYFLCCTRWFKRLSLEEILWCDHSNEIYWAVLSCGTGKFCYVVQGGYNFKSLCMKSYSVPIQMEATEQHSLVTLFIMLNKVVLSFECMREILWSDHWNERYWAVLSFGTVHYVVQSGSCFWVWMRRSSVTIQMKVTEEYFPVVVLIMLYEIVLNFEAVDEIGKCDHINESYWPVNSCGDVYAMKGGC